MKDICQSLILSLNNPQARNEVFNVGTGIATSIKQIADLLAENINPKITPSITNKFRPGDIRHCYADISKIQSKLGYEPKFLIEDGIKELIEWVISLLGNGVGGM